MEEGFQVDKMMVFNDSQAAIDGLIGGGVGRLKHISIRALCLQESIRAETIILKKMRGEENVAGVLAKHLGEENLVSLCWLACQSR